MQEIDGPAAPSLKACACMLNASAVQKSIKVFENLLLSAHNQD